MAKPKINLRLGMTGVLLAVLTGVGVFAASAATLDWIWLTTAPLSPPARTGHTATLVKLVRRRQRRHGGRGLVPAEPIQLARPQLIFIYTGPRAWAPLPVLS